MSLIPDEQFRRKCREISDLFDKTSTYEMFVDRIEQYLDTLYVYLQNRQLIYGYPVLYAYAAVRMLCEKRNYSYEDMAAMSGLRGDPTYAICYNTRSFVVGITPAVLTAHTRYIEPRSLVDLLTWSLSVASVKIPLSMCHLFNCCPELVEFAITNKIPIQIDWHMPNIILKPDVVQWVLKNRFLFEETVNIPVYTLYMDICYQRRLMYYWLSELLVVYDAFPNSTSAVHTRRRKFERALERVGLPSEIVTECGTYVHLGQVRKYKPETIELVEPIRLKYKRGWRDWIMSMFTCGSL